MPWFLYQFRCKSITGHLGNFLLLKISVHWATLRPVNSAPLHPKVQNNKNWVSLALPQKWQVFPKLCYLSVEISCVWTIWLFQVSSSRANGEKSKVFTVRSWREKTQSTATFTILNVVSNLNSTGQWIFGRVKDSSMSKNAWLEKRFSFNAWKY